jgi:hypothetical protein
MKRLMQPANFTSPVGKEREERMRSLRHCFAFQVPLLRQWLPSCKAEFLQMSKQPPSVFQIETIQQKEEATLNLLPTYA